MCEGAKAPYTIVSAALSEKQNSLSAVVRRQGVHAPGSSGAELPDCYAVPYFLRRRMARAERANRLRVAVVGSGTAADIMVMLRLLPLSVSV